MRNSLQLSIACLSVLSCVLSAAAWCQPACAPPDSLKAKFAGSPDVAALNELGVWFGDQKNYTCAANAFASSLQMDPKQKGMAQVAFMFGASLYLAGDSKEAIAALQEAEKFGYHDIKLHLVLAEALDSTHSYADAENEWRAALEIDPEYADALDKLSTDLLAGNNDKAVIDLLDTPRLAPLRTVQQCLNLAQAYIRIGKLPESKKVLREGVNTYPDSLPLAKNLADVLTKSGEKPAAAAVLATARARHATSSDPEDH